MSEISLTVSKLPQSVMYTGAVRCRAPKQLSGLEPVPPASLPPGWPLPRSTQVWVLHSTSGRACAFTKQRTVEYAALLRRVAQLPWPAQRADPAHRGCQGKHDS